MKFSKDIEAFNNNLWGRESYELTVKYLLAPLSPKTNNLFGFPWAFLVWAFEVIPHLRQQVTAKGEVSSPRILRWLTTKNVKNYPDLFNLPDDVASSCSRFSSFLCKKCKKQDDDVIKYLHTLTETVNELKYKRGVIPSRNVWDPYTPQTKRRRKSFIKTIFNMKKKIFGELSMAIGEKMVVKKMDIYLCLHLKRLLYWHEWKERIIANYTL
ncbi:hypothetical protein R3W88_024275 [Solanum pinnatisectum]|uniref:Uncharacterized protein n=1 Tax=Solanum pinnatisectum TaxID=50273 RepID=A0AAV9M018_9SOLN|nr:hypothetical protein R3W88_024275 [Solanum pinnatisectum]